MEIRETFATRLKLLRDENLLSLAELAKKIGVSSVSLGHYERQARVPDIEMLGRIAQYFNVTTDYLLGFSDNRIIENANIGEITGLSDLAIESLKQIQERGPKSHLKIVNLILEEWVSGDFDFPTESIENTKIYDEYMDKSSGFLDCLVNFFEANVEESAAVVFWEKLPKSDPKIIAALSALSINSLIEIINSAFFEELKEAIEQLKDIYLSDVNHIKEKNIIKLLYESNPEFKEDYEKYLYEREKLINDVAQGLKTDEEYKEWITKQIYFW